MTAVEAKELSLEIWRYMAEHPKIKSKSELPKRLFEKIKSLSEKCPLCEHFHLMNKKLYRYRKIDKRLCEGCPLNTDHLFCFLHYHWAISLTTETRKVAAQKIVDKIEEWEV